MYNPCIYMSLSENHNICPSMTCPIIWSMSSVGFRDTRKHWNIHKICIIHAFICPLLKTTIFVPPWPVPYRELCQVFCLETTEALLLKIHQNCIILAFTCPIRKIALCIYMSLTDKYNICPSMTCPIKWSMSSAW